MYAGNPDKLNPLFVEIDNKASWVRIRDAGLFERFLHIRRTRSALAEAAVAKTVTPIHPQRVRVTPPSVDPAAIPTNMKVKSKALARLRASGAMPKTIV